jgi:hypothetical protein
MVGSGKGVAVGLLIALSLAGGTAALAAAEKDGPGSAATTYDGTWSVVVSSRDGLCSGAYRYPVAIVNGQVRHADRGNQALDIRGRVQADGRVSVDVGRGDLRAHGVGKLSQSSGGGTWRSTTGCTGRWQADRRA